MASLSEFNKLTNVLEEQEYLMPSLFVGHGSPMNGIEDNEFSRTWTLMASKIPTPAAVVVISAHWLTRGTQVTAMDFPETIHDFGGFPQALYDVQYPAPGNAALAREMTGIVRSAKLELSHDWGLDHGAWTIVRRMYPKANIPVLQMSIDYTKGVQYHYDLASELISLRKKGVLIMGSGNMVHNLRMVEWSRIDEPGFGYDWAIRMNETFKRLICERNHQSLIRYEDFGTEGKLAIPTPEHYLPLLYSLGVSSDKDDLHFFNDKAVAGSLTMTSVMIGEKL